MSEQEPLVSSPRDYGAAVDAAVPPVGFADFSPTELYSLSESIAGDVERVNAALRALHKLLRQVGGAGDTLMLRDNIHSTQQSVNARVARTARDLQRLGAVVRRGDKPQKLQVERLKVAFTEALAGYAALQKQLREKMQANMPLAARARAGPGGAGAGSAGAAGPAGAADDAEATLLAGRQAQARLIEFETSMLLEREAYVNKIEADVIDVNQIMAELADIVNSQGVTIDTVESQVEAAGSRVEAGAEELAKAAGYQRKYRRKVLVLLAVAALVATVLVVILVRSLS